MTARIIIPIAAPFAVALIKHAGIMDTIPERHQKWLFPIVSMALGAGASMGLANEADMLADAISGANSGGAAVAFHSIYKHVREAKNGGK